MPLYLRVNELDQFDNGDEVERDRKVRSGTARVAGAEVNDVPNSEYCNEK
jgi:hypothetical protein|nr:MAG TPA: hypothetical protein [Caudoviricetes sp.]